MSWREVGDDGDSSTGYRRLVSPEQRTAVPAIPVADSRLRSRHRRPPPAKTSVISPDRNCALQLMLRLVFDAFKNLFGLLRPGAAGRPQRPRPLRRAPMLEQPLKFFIVFFVVVEPISLIPLFSGLT